MDRQKDEKEKSKGICFYTWSNISHIDLFTSKRNRKGAVDGSAYSCTYVMQRTRYSNENERNRW